MEECFGTAGHPCLGAVREVKQGAVGCQAIYMDSHMDGSRVCMGKKGRYHRHFDIPYHRKCFIHCKYSKSRIPEIFGGSIPEIAGHTLGLRHPPGHPGVRIISGRRVCATPAILIVSAMSILVHCRHTRATAAINIISIIPIACQPIWPLHL
jgi:hypothetical protein